MGQKSAIEWTDHTFNPWWGCVKVSPGCANCYAETWANRYGFNVWGRKSNRRTFSEKHWHQPLIWNQVAAQNHTKERVFCASMADVFEDNPSIEIERQKLWKLIEATPNLNWLLLTKRPENMLRFAPWKHTWPKNIWAMTSVENQEQANERIPYLIEIPATVLGLSIEPLLGLVNIDKWIDKLHWVIVGGESGPHARLMHPDWARIIRDDCKQQDVPFFFKQWGNWIPCNPDDREAISLDSSYKTDTQIYMKRTSKKAAGRMLDDMLWNEFPRVANLARSPDTD